MTRTTSPPTTAPADTTGQEDTGPDVAEVEVRLDGLGPELAALREATAKHKHYKRLREKLERDFKNRLGDATAGTIDGVPVITWRATVRESVSLSVLEERYPAIAAVCREAKPVRTFLLLD